jgi:biotin transport system substrate-specific component
MSNMNQINNLSSILAILFGVALITLSAQTSLDIPFISTDIPGTWQTFAVLIFAYSTNRWLGFIAIMIYLALGYFGYPVFAEGASGSTVLFGKTGGYLSGFLVGAFVVGWLGEKGWATSFPKSLLAMAIGTWIILAIGTAYLANFIGWSDAFNYGFVPFWIGALIKIIVGASIWSFYEWLVKYHSK